MLKFVSFLNMVKDFIATLPPLFTVTVVGCLAILIILAVKRAVF